jgi:hypothetical protein
VTAVIILVLVAVGLPLLAWWVARRRFWTTHRARTDRDPWTAILLAHRLDPVEMREVAAAIGWGSRLPEPHLRRAVADWAGRDLRRIEEDRRHPSAFRRRAVVTALGGALLVLGVLAFRFVAGSSGAGDITVLVVLTTLVVGGLVAEPLEQARLRRVIRRNTD